MARPKLRVIVAGSRTVKNYHYVRERLMAFLRDHPNQRIVWITGRAAEGPDDMLYHFAKWDVPGELIEMKADWEKHNRSAGYIRNAEMGAVADELILFWDGRSRGSRHMKDCMVKQNKPVTTYVMNTDDTDGDFEVFDFRTLSM